MSEQNTPEFEERLRVLLARAAEVIPADTDLSARVRQELVRSPRGPRGCGIVGPRNVLVTIAAVLVVALLAGTLTFMHPGRGPIAGGVTGQPTSTATIGPTSRFPTIGATAEPSSTLAPLTCGTNGIAGMGGGVTNPDLSTGNPVDHSIAVGRHASLHGITITIDRAYADATETIITYHMQTNINPPLPAVPVLLDAQGHRYGMISGDWTVDGVANYIFTPLPAEELGAPQTLTFYTQQMQLVDSEEPGTAPGSLVEGPWKISFTLTPATGKAVDINAHPLTRNELSVQPLRIETAPVGGGLLEAAGGVRVIVRLSGLEPSMPIGELYGFDTAAGPGGSSPGCGGVILELALPNGQQFAPGFVHVLEQTVPTTPAEQEAAQGQTVGPSGTVDIEALFYLPIPTSTDVTLYLNHLAAQVSGATKSQQISGPWAFRIPPSA